MRIWNINNKDITQLYNNNVIILKAESIVDVSDDCAVFLLNKKELKGRGLVQLKDGDSKEERYKEGRLNIYNWVVEKYTDYKRHCEEREAQRLQPLAPHKEILEHKAIIDDYEKWVAEGEIVKDEFKDVIREAEKIFACPYCDKEIANRLAYFEHLKTHEKEKDAVDISATKDTS